ncbi:MAG: GAF domain-containing protein [Anaerolineales bacterium]|nr:GAF domain-containing protein [Anaerolineales bacterium]
MRPSLTFSPDLGDAYNLFQTLQRVLAELVHHFPCETAYLAVRQGETFRLEAVWNANDEPGGYFNLGQTIILAPDRLSGELVETGQGQISVEPDEINALAPSGPLSPPFLACLAAPLRIGQRIIGLAVFFATHPDTFPNDSLPRVHELARHAAPLVENAVTLAEAERHLQRLALLNELAAAASASQDVESVARRVLRLLRRTFQTSRVGLFLLAPDGHTLQSYGEDRRRARKNNLTLDPGVGARVLDAGTPLRLETVNGNHLHTLWVPLKYRAQPVGVLGLETDSPPPFSLQDEQLLLVIASHLAGLIENVHLNEETRDRARNLTAIHHIVQQIVGLVDAAEIAQTTTALTAGQFECDLVLILMMSEADHTLIAEGVGGKLAGYVRLGEQYPLPPGEDMPEPLTSLARAGFLSGEGRMSIPLHAGEQILGMIHIFREDRFTENDRLVLESLAGVLSSVLLNARRYQQLQERIEAQKLAEKKMVEAARLAAIGEIAAGVAHELNNPLTTIAGFTELVLEDLFAEPRAQENLALVLQEARRARDVVRRLLDFSRQDESFKVPADINEILGEALALVHHLARASGVEIQYVPWDALPLIRMDRGQIKQVILNLVQNALHAMPRGGSLILQTTLEGRDDRDWVALRVLDTGEGIPVDLIPRIFEPFFTTKPPGQGTGLGLSISNHIVVEHEGFMEVESERGHGTCFTVWLPVVTL